MIRRQLQDVIESRMFAGKAIVVIGARQVGKSTLFNMVLEGRKEPVLRLNCDEPAFTPGSGSGCGAACAAAT